MNPALKPILAAIESAVVRIEYARDDEHALNEAIQLAADARALLALLSDGPAFTEADPVPVLEDVSELARRCGLVADIKGRDEDEWAYLVEDTGAVRIAHTSWWDRERDKKREPGWAIFEDWRLFATIEDAVRAYAADHTLPRVGARITAKSP